MIWVARHLTSPLLAPLQILPPHHPPLHHHFLAPLSHIIHRLLNLRGLLPDASVKFWDFQGHFAAYMGAPSSGRYKKSPALATTKAEEDEEWQRNGTGRLDVRGFRELKI
jgi:hypothetical protein